MNRQDLVHEFHPIAHPFYNQVAEIDTAIRVCRTDRAPYEGVRAITTGGGNDDGAISADDPFNNFRNIPVLANQMQYLSLVHLESGTYLQVPSWNASCERAVSVYSSDNTRLHVESNTDTRFAVTTRPEGAQPRHFEQSRRGARGGRHITRDRNTQNGQRLITNGEDEHVDEDDQDNPTGPRLITNGQGIPTGPRLITDDRDIPTGPRRMAARQNASNAQRRVTSSHDILHAQPRPKDGAEQAEEDYDDGDYGRVGGIGNEGNLTRDQAQPLNQNRQPNNHGSEIRGQYEHAANVFNRAYRAHRNGYYPREPAANRVASRDTFNVLHRSQLHPTDAGEQVRPETRRNGGEGFAQQVHATQGNSVKEIESSASQDVRRGQTQNFETTNRQTIAPLPITALSRGSRRNRHRGRRRERSSEETHHVAYSAVQPQGLAFNHDHGNRNRRAGDALERGYLQGGMSSNFQPLGRTFNQNQHTRMIQAGNQQERGGSHNEMRSTAQLPGRAFNDNHDTRMIQPRDQQERGAFHDDMRSTVQRPGLAFNQTHNDRNRQAGDQPERGHSNEDMSAVQRPGQGFNQNHEMRMERRGGQPEHGSVHDDMRLGFETLPRPEAPSFNDAYGNDPRSYVTSEVHPPGYGADGFQGFLQQQSYAHAPGTTPSALHGMPTPRATNSTHPIHELLQGSIADDPTRASRVINARYPTHELLEGSVPDGPPRATPRPHNWNGPVDVFGFPIKVPLDDTWITINGVTRRMTYKEHFEMKYRGGVGPKRTVAENQTAAEHIGQERLRTNASNGPAALSARPLVDRVVTTPAGFGQLNAVHESATTRSISTNSTTTLISPRRPLALDEIWCRMASDAATTGTSSPSTTAPQNLEGRVSRFADFWDSPEYKNKPRRGPRHENAGDPAIWGWDRN
jgi:hypothetical protein